ncbi:uncharacterized protein LOC119161618 isoform X4 [Rhipicephalus microplus]|uniref:uncharacterized protein LOC119161618 isoform X4 n=1 Tax=Rhipicephalus microplus TaxID=6941 RepID=UPI003F6B6C61
MLARLFSRRCQMTRCFWTSAEEDANPGPKTEEERRQRTEEYRKLFRDIDSSVRSDRLSDNERKVHEAHKLAVQCPYQHINAKDEVKDKMKFNSAFYVPKI